jgi:hypothetical protein
MASPGTRCLLALLLAATVIAEMCAESSDADEPPSAATDAIFYGWVLGSGISSTNVTPADARRRLDSILKSWVIYIDQLSGLTEDQQTKLRLAGLGDIQHFLDKVEEKRQVFQTIRHDPIQVQAFRKEIRPLQKFWISNPFLEGSLFWKTLRKTLPAAQFAKLESKLREQERNESRELVRGFVKHERSRLKLRDSQCVRLEKLLLKETQRSNRLAAFRYCGILEQVSEIPEPRLRPIFEESQWQELQQELEWARQAPPNSSDLDFYFYQQGQGIGQRRVKQAR